MAFKSPEQRKAVMAMLASGKNPRIRKRSKRWGRVGATVAGASGALSAARKVGGLKGVPAKYKALGIAGTALGGAVGGYIAGRAGGSGYERLGVKHQVRTGKRKRGAGLKTVQAAAALLAPIPTYAYSRVRGPRGSVRGRRRRR
jgi:hypothetical protein